jgi:excisionase family DNA binding protein
MQQDFFSPEQVAERLGLHVRTIRNYVRSGRLRAVRLGKQYRIAPKDLAKLTGQPQSTFQPKVGEDHRHVEASSIVEIDAINPEIATRISTLLMGAANTRKGRNSATRVETIYDARRMHMKIILVGTMEDNAAFFNLIDGILKS